MTDNTVEYDGTEYNVDNLEAALDKLPNEEDTAGDYAVVGDVTIKGDGFYDSDVYITTTDNVEEVSSADGIRLASGSTFTSTVTLRSVVEAAQEQTFEEYVIDIENVYDENTVEEGGSRDVVVSHGFLCSEEVQALVNDDGVEIGKVEGSHDERRVRFHLKDVRDE